MSDTDNTVDFSKFKNKQQEVENKIDRFANFTSFLGGLILGAILSFPLQLLLRPLSYENSALTYGPSTLISSAPVWLIPLISVLLLIFVLLITLAGYVGWLGIVGQETVKLSYECDDFNSFYEGMRDYLDEEAKFTEAEIRAKNNWIKCLDPGRRPEAELFRGTIGLSPIGTSLLVDLMVDYVFPKTIIELDFDPELSIVELRYDPNSENATHLLEKLESRY